MYFLLWVTYSETLVHIYSENVSHLAGSNSMRPRIIAQQAPLSIKFCRQEYCSGLPFHSPGDLSAPGIKPMSPALWAHSLSYEPTSKPLQVCSGILLYSGSQSFSRFGLLLLLLFRIFSLFWLIVGLPSVPGRWYKWIKQTWWQFLGIAGDCDFMSKTKKGTFPVPCLDVHWNCIPAWFLQLSTSAHFPSLSS